MPVPENLEIRQIALEIYGGCNYRCPMCPQSEGRESDFLKKLPFDVFKKIIDEGKQYGCELVSLHGSGEATMHPQMPEFVRYVKAAGMRCITVSNGHLLSPALSRKLIEAGIDAVRVSGIGYDRDTYQKWMSKDAFDRVRQHVKEFIRLNAEIGGSSELRTYHLVLDARNADQEIAKYKEVWIDHCGVQGEIWLMHNWSGLYSAIPYGRRAEGRRSCGRPRAPYLNVRAGGLDGHHGAVVPCCFVLGQDSSAVLGHLDTQTIAEVVGGDKYNTLRLKHDQGMFDDLAYCRSCDQLLDVPESLVWTNIPGKKYGQSKVLQDLDYRQWSA